MIITQLFTHKKLNEFAPGDYYGGGDSGEGVAEATGDKPFDQMMTTIKRGTNKQKTADQKEQQKQTQQQARNAFGNMFGGGNPADKLKIREQGVAEASDRMQKYGQLILKRKAEQNAAAQAAGPQPKKEEPPASSDYDSMSTRDFMKQLRDQRRPKKKGVAEGDTLMNKLHQALLQEGRVKELADDLKTLSDAEFIKKYGKAKAAIRRDMKKLDEQGVAEGSLNEFARGNGGDDGDDGEEFNPDLAKMAQEHGFTKGVSLADGSSLATAFKITKWDLVSGGLYKQYFVQGFKEGRMDKINFDNKQYNLNLKLMKDGSIRHGEQGVAESETNYDSEWDEKVKRLGQMAKEGPRKTVWDPVKRVYKTVPVNAPQDKKVPKPVAERLLNSLVRPLKINEDAGVLKLQQMLISKGARIEADGIMGPLTRAAMKQFGGGRASAPTKSKPGVEKKIAGVVTSGPGYTDVKTTDGELQRREGTRNWRNNNPGNIRKGGYAQSKGAVGDDGAFAVFPSLEVGMDAKEALIFGPKYINLSIQDAISRYAPPSENDTQGYIKQVCQATGTTPDITLSKLNPAQRDALLKTISKVEGFKVGNIKVVSNVAEGIGSTLAGLGLAGAMARTPSSIPKAVVKEAEINQPDPKYSEYAQLMAKYDMLAKEMAPDASGLGVQKGASPDAIASVNAIKAKAAQLAGPNLQAWEQARQKENADSMTQAQANLPAMAAQLENIESTLSPEHKKVAIDAVMKTVSEHRVNRQALMAKMLNSH